MNYHRSLFRHILLALMLLLGLQKLSAQGTALPKVLLDVPQDTVFIHPDSLKKPHQLPDKFIIPSSEKLHIRNFSLLRNIHYRIDYREGLIQLLRTFPEADTLRIIYRSYPFPLIADYSHRELQKISPGDSSGEQTEIARLSQPKFLEDFDTYQSRLQKSGSIFRGIEIGSNQDLTLNSGLNLQLSGNIAPDVEIVAALTDESTPIQPEGNTQTLREVDNVFVTVKSPYLAGTLGDFNMAYRQSLFGNVQRKLQGISLANTVRPTRQQLTFGTSRGFFQSNRLLGQEGNQGPYQLTGRNGEREIIVLAGTERVYVDGVLQIRGENYDYIIDYSLAQITFTSKRLITSENRIEVDFEYTSNFQRYARNFLGGSSTARQVGKFFSYDLRLFREWDDTNNLLEDDQPLTAEEEAALAAAGNDPLKAAVSGAVFVGPGNGNYQRADTLLPGVSDTTEFFRYAGSEQGDYDVRFTSIGAGNGEYVRERAGVFRFVGPGKGAYLPIKLVPLASDRRFADLGLGIEISRNWNILGEAALSDFDRNIFSSIDNENNRGKAFQLSTTLQDTAVNFLGKRLGNLRFSGKWKQQEENFASLDRLFQPEYAYQWNLSQAIASINQENSLEAAVTYLPFRFLKFDGNLGSLDKGDNFSSDRRFAQLQLFRTFLPDLSYRIETVDSRAEFDKSNWLRQRFLVSKNFQKVIPRYSYNMEDRSVDNRTSGKVTGFVFKEHKAGVDIRKVLGIDWGLNYQNRQDFLYDPNQRNQTLKHALTNTVEFLGTINPDARWQGIFSFTFRDKDFTDFFQQLPPDSIAIFQPDPQFQDTSWQDRRSQLANLELRYRNASGTLNSRWDYKVSSELQEIREKFYLEVGENRGNFVFDSTLSEFVPDPLGNFILVQLPTGKFESVVGLETGWQLQYRPKISRNKEGGLKNIWNNTSLLSYIKIEEKTKDDNILDIYLLNLSKFHSIENSLRTAFILNHDINYNERNPNWGLLLRSRYRDNLSNQFLDSDNNETRIVWERLIQSRRRFLKRKLNLTLEYRNTLNKRWVTASPSRNRNILSQAFIPRFNFRPNLSWQFQLDIERGIERDRNIASLLRINYWDLRPQLSYSIRGKARATADLTFIQVEEVDNPFNRPIPFEMGKGKKVGNSWQWNLRFEYFISSFITINANYNGRRDAEATRTIHLGKAEVRAFF